MTWPTISFGAAFGVDPFDPGFIVFSELSLYLTRLTITSPTRSRIIDTFGAGSMVATLDNSDRRFDPTNLSGPYVSGGESLIIPNLLVQAGASYGGTDYELSTCYRDTGRVTWGDPEWSQASWSLTDAFKLLGRAPTVPVGAAVGADELSGARVARILDAVGWPSGSSWRSVDTGLSRMQGTLLDIQPLEELQLVAASEGGELWCDGGGRITFKDRSYRTSTTTWTFSDASGTLDYTDLVLADDEDMLINYASVARVGGLPQVTQDAASQTRYGPSTTARWSRSDLVMSLDLEAAAVSQMAVDLYANAVVRFESMTVNPTVNDALWPFVLGMQLGDRVTITKTPPGGGSAITRTCFVEGWQHDISPGDGGAQGVWITNVVLSDAEDWEFDTDVWDSATWDDTEWFY